MQIISKLLAASCVLALTHTASFAEGFKRPPIANRNIYANSDIIANQGTHTILPKSCILYVPENLKKKVTNASSGRFLLWPKFYAQNYAWLTKKEVTLAHASGEKAFTPEELERFKQANKIVIATHHNNPISVRKVSQATTNTLD